MRAQKGANSPCQQNTLALPAAWSQEAVSLYIIKNENTIPLSRTDESLGKGTAQKQQVGEDNTNPTSHGFAHVPKSS